MIKLYRIYFKFHFEIILYNYGLHEKLISIIIIKLRKGYFPEVRI